VGDQDGVLHLRREDEHEGDRPETAGQPLGCRVELDDAPRRLHVRAGDWEGLVGPPFYEADPLRGLGDLGGAAQAVDRLRGVDDDPARPHDGRRLPYVLVRRPEDLHRP